MKISFIIYKYFPFGGQQRDFLSVVTECINRGYQVQVFVINWEGQIPNKIELKRFPHEKNGHLRRLRHFTSRVQLALASQERHLVIGFNKIPGLDIYFAVDPCFAEKAQEQRSKYYKFTPRYRHFIKYERQVFSENSDTDVFYLTEYQRNSFARFYPEFKGHFHFLPPGLTRDRRIDVTHSKEVGLKVGNADELRSSLGLKPTDLMVLQVGSGFKVKGVDRSLRAIAALPVELRSRVFYVLVGQDKVGRFSRLAKKLKIFENFSYIGPREDIPELLAAADLMLHPAYAESAGYTILEAVVAGLPILTTASCGYAFHVERSNAGCVVKEPYHQKCLDDALINMLKVLSRLGKSRSDWSSNGLIYGAEGRFFEMPELAVNKIEAIAERKSLVT